MVIVDLSANETKARAYSQQGHGNQNADPKGRIHMSDFLKTCN